MKKNDTVGAQKYVALVGLNYRRPGGAIEVATPKGKRKSAEIRVEAGEVVELPSAVAEVYLAQGAIEPHPKPEPPPPGALSVAEDAGNLSVAEAGQLDVVKE